MPRKYPPGMIAYGSTESKLLRADEIQKRKGHICEICNMRVPTLYIDHDHRSGLVRGFICGPCNSGLGCLQDNFAILRAAADYLERAHTKNLEWHEFLSKGTEYEEIPSWLKRRTSLWNRSEADQHLYD